MIDDASLKSALLAARDAARAGNLPTARAVLQEQHRGRPDHAETAIALARLSLAMHDFAEAQAVLSRAAGNHPQGHEALAVELAVARAGAGRLTEAMDALRSQVARAPQSPLAWLLLGQMLEDAGQAFESACARFEALSRAHRLGYWIEPHQTPPHLVQTVAAAIVFVRRHRRAVFESMLAPLRERHGEGALVRVERALAGYLGEVPAVPPDGMQRPRFFYVPDLPALPFLDPGLQPWASRLRAAFDEVREEALRVVQEDAGLEDFVEVKPGDDIGNYLGGRRPAWEAFFFYRHGRRFDANHWRCPRTSAVLESIELCRIPGQTPEICFSVLAAGTHILPHHGVTNTRTVMHLPLLVPEGCALNLVERGEHRWREGELVLFDDTYLHEAWNHSTSPRVILLMDCWNPHLSAVEREAVSVISQTIGTLDVALASRAWSTYAVDA